MADDNEPIGSRSYGSRDVGYAEQYCRTTKTKEVRPPPEKPKTPTKQDLLEIIRELVEAGKPWGYTPERCGICHNFSESGFCAKALGKGNVKHTGSPPDWCPRRKLAAATEKAEDEPVEV